MTNPTSAWRKAAVNLICLLLAMSIRPAAGRILSFRPTREI